MISARSISLPHGITLDGRVCGDPARPVLLFLHGFPEGAFIWDAQLAHFSQPEHGGYYTALGALRRLEQLVQEAVVTVPRALIAETIDIVAVLSGRGAERRLAEIAHVDGLDPATGDYRTLNALILAQQPTNGEPE